MIRCPNCQQSIALPANLVESGVEKAQCVQCGSRFCVLPGGSTALLSGDPSGGTLQAEGGNRASGGSSGDSSTPRMAGGIDLPNLSAMASPDQQAAILEQARSAHLMDYPKLPVGTVFRDKFRIDAEIGQGASAVVYRARDVDAEMDVALKVVGVVGGQADGIRQAWAEEYKARRRVADGSHLLTLESPQVQEIDGTTYVALPQELGEMTLRDWLNEARSDIAQHREEALRLFGEVCRGVEALHDNNLAHLDLKPENIILVQNGKDRLVAKVGDFGLARAAGGMQRREGVGTPKYMAPEQVRSAREKDIGPWSDIYALGCILFELLDGDAPFSGNSEDLKDKHLNMAPPELEDIPGYLEGLVMACLTKKRKDRPDAVVELRRSIETNPEEEKAFEQARKKGTEAGWEEFLEAWGEGRYGESAREALEALVDARRRHELDAFEQTKRKNTESAWQSFLDFWSAGQYVTEARKALRALELERERKQKQRQKKEKEARERREEKQREQREREEAKRKRREEEQQQRREAALKEKEEAEKRARQQREFELKQSKEAERQKKELDKDLTIRRLSLVDASCELLISDPWSLSERRAKTDINVCCSQLRIDYDALDAHEGLIAYLTVTFTVEADAKIIAIAEVVEGGLFSTSINENENVWEELNSILYSEARQHLIQLLIETGIPFIPPHRPVTLPHRVPPLP